jgi:hypothetical protein
MAQNLFQLMYVSRSVISTQPGEFESAVQHILAASARNNAPAGLTGALLYDRGRFLQWIEGPAEAVGQRFATIFEDPRHTDIEVVLRRAASARRFPKWRMAFTHVGEAAIYRLTGMPLADESPERLTAFIEAALADASTLSVAA